MNQCRYRSLATGHRCTAEATQSVEGELSDGTVDRAACCEVHEREFRAGWDRMQRDAARLKASKLPESDIARIMLARVERGAYEQERPSNAEALTRALEERFSSATIGCWYEPSGESYVDVSLPSHHFNIECRADGSYGLIVVGGSLLDVKFSTVAALIEAMALRLV